METQSTAWRVGDQVEVAVFLNTEQESINALEGHIRFPANLVDIQGIRDGNSIVTFWITRPKVRAPGDIVFSGGTPGGYTGKHGPLFSIILRSKKDGEGTIYINTLKALKNDGRATQARVTAAPLRFTTSEKNISEAAAAAVPLLVQEMDTQSPEIFTPAIARDESVFGGKWFLVFATQDKGSGIDHYEVKESQLGNIWFPAESPYVLRDQDLRSTIYIKAIDKAGNDIVIQVAARQTPRWYENWRVWTIIVLLGAAVYLVLRFLRCKLWNQGRTTKK